MPTEVPETPTTEIIKNYQRDMIRDFVIRRYKEMYDEKIESFIEIILDLVISMNHIMKTFLHLSAKH